MHFISSLHLRTVILSLLALFSFLFFAYPDANAETRDEAISLYAEHLLDIESLGMTEDQAYEYATDVVDQLIEQMDGDQASAKDALAELQTRVDGMHSGNTRKEDAETALETAATAVAKFVGLDATYCAPKGKEGYSKNCEGTTSDHISILIQVGDVMPLVEPDAIFKASQVVATEAMSEVNKIMVLPIKPEPVPDPSLFGLLAQIVRLLFRFAWVVVFVSLTVSGIYFVISFNNEERITKAKDMIIYSLVGFAFVTLAFALVKAVTDIDFFAFI
jgi:hypothetical protein